MLTRKNSAKDIKITVKILIRLMNENAVFFKYTEIHHHGNTG